MDLGIAGKVALVLGGSQGIGRAVASELSREGCAVAVVARGQPGIDAVIQELHAAGGEAQGIAADMTDLDAYARIIDTMKGGIGAPDIVVFLPPNPGPGAFLELTEEDLAKGYRDLVLCFGRLVHVCLPHMKQRRWGRFVTAGAGASKEPMRGQLGFEYAIANINRMAAVRLCKQIAVEVAPFGITVNTIATGPIDTGLFTKFFSERAAETGVSADEFIGNIVAKIPVGRMGTPEEMAGLCLYLCSNRAGFTTGENILCDGGLMNTPM